jgi:hypothetical protein
MGENGREANGGLRVEARLALRLPKLRIPVCCKRGIVPEVRSRVFTLPLGHVICLEPMEQVNIMLVTLPMTPIPLGEKFPHASCPRIPFP